MQRTLSSGWTSSLTGSRRLLLLIALCVAAVGWVVATGYFAPGSNSARQGYTRVVDGSGTKIWAKRLSPDGVPLVRVRSAGGTEPSCSSEGPEGPGAFTCSKQVNGSMLFMVQVSRTTTSASIETSDGSRALDLVPPPMGWPHAFAVGRIDLGSAELVALRVATGPTPAVEEYPLNNERRSTS